ncbi:MAG: hypothetical protein NC395_01570 [Prevotella sp.]|nr:hypothetical protein [Prevotella sp.]
MEKKNKNAEATAPRVPEKTNGDKHNLMPDETSWAEDAKEEMEDYIESQGIHIRQ